VNLVNRTAALALTCTVGSFGACGGEVPARGAAGASSAVAASGAEAAPPGPAGSAASAARTASAPDHGYGDRIAWRGLEEGLKEAAELGRPLMLVVHAAWCPRCKELKRRFFDPSLAETSERMIMVNVDQDQTPEALRHGPDGQYIPRVLFFDPQGHLDADLSNPGRKKYKYFYTPQDDLVGMMKQALDRHEQAAKL
jgi:protein-disulfide reductase (glutathione)